jgi:hypothetical protein
MCAVRVLVQLFDIVISALVPRSLSSIVNELPMYDNISTIIGYEFTGTSTTMQCVVPVARRCMQRGTGTMLIPLMACCSTFAPVLARNSTVCFDTHPQTSVLAGILNSAEARLRFGGAAAIQLYDEYTRWYNKGCPIPLPPSFNSVSPSSSQWHIYLIVVVICVGVGLLTLFGVTAAFRYFCKRSSHTRSGPAPSPSGTWTRLATKTRYTPLEISRVADIDSAPEESDSHGADGNSGNTKTTVTEVHDGDRPASSFALSGGIGDDGGAATGTGILRQSRRTSDEDTAELSEDTALLTTQ